MTHRSAVGARTSLIPCRSRLFALASAAPWLWLAIALSAPAYDLHFDYTSFGSTFGQSQLNVLNYPSINGNYMMTSGDNHRPEMVANGNELAEFYNWFCCSTGSDYLKSPRPTAQEEADAIDAYVKKNSPSIHGTHPWLILNELSPSLWQQNPGDPSLSEFRTWAIDAITRLNDVYGYKVITYAPYQQLMTTANAPSWQALAAKSYIAIEAYLDGNEVWNSGSTYAQRVAYAQGRYQAAKNSYLNVGVPESKLFVSEHFANNASGVTWGRAGLMPASAWDQVIQVRQDAIYNADFAGFLAYSWGGNGLLVSQNEQISHEYYYRSRMVLHSQKPQWLSDSSIDVVDDNGNLVSIPLSWSQPLNWLGGVPNTTGAEVNFWRTLTANRAITLDGSKTVGTMSFDSPYSYTINPGTGGSIVFNNSASAATLTSNQGNHTINTDVQLTSSLNASINTGTFTINGTVSGAGELSKSGSGTLALTATNSYTGDTHVQAGTLSISNRYLADTANVLLSNSSALNLQFSGSADVIRSLLVNNVSQVIGVWGAVENASATYHSTRITGTGLLQVTVGPVVGDYNDDGKVDSSDYTAWRKSTGEATIINRDPNNAGPIGQADFLAWRTHFGQTAVSESAATQQVRSGAAVPEPQAVAFVALSAIIFLFGLHRSALALGRR